MVLSGILFDVWSGHINNPFATFQPFKSDMKPSFLKLLAQGARSMSDNEHGGEGSGHKRRRDGAHKEKSKRAKGSRSTDDDSHDSSSAGSGDDEMERVTPFLPASVPHCHHRV